VGGPSALTAMGYHLAIHQGRRNKDFERKKETELQKPNRNQGVHELTRLKTYSHDRNKKSVPKIGRKRGKVESQTFVIHNKREVSKATFSTGHARLSPPMKKGKTPYQKKKRKGGDKVKVAHRKTKRTSFKKKRSANGGALVR